MRTGSSTSGNLVGLLGIVFVVLKLTGVVAWPWWFVLLPFYGGLVLVAALLIVAAVLFGIAKLLDRK